MSFFERYFAALDGPDPYSSLDLVAGDVEFAIEWAADAGRRSTQILGGRERLREFIDAGNMNGWSHHLLHTASGTAAGGDQVEYALGETRRDDGSVIATFLAVAELDAGGRMRRYLVARTPAVAFGPGA